MDYRPSTPDQRVAVVWAEFPGDAIVGKVFNGYRRADLEAAPRRIISSDRTGTTGITITRTSDSYFITWRSAERLLGQFWNESLSASLGAPLVISTRPDASWYVKADYDPFRDRILVLWFYPFSTLRYAVIAADSNSLVSTDDVLTSNAFLHNYYHGYALAANVYVPGGPAFMVISVVGSGSVRQEIRAFPITGRASGPLVRGPEKVLTTGPARDVYGTIDISYNQPFNGYAIAYSDGDRILYVTTDADANVARRGSLMTRVSADHPRPGYSYSEGQYSLQLDLNPNSVGLLVYSQAQERLPGMQIFGRRVRGLGTARVTVDPEHAIGSRSTGTDFHEHLRVYSNWRGGLVWFRLVSDPTSTRRQAMYVAVDVHGAPLE